MKDNVIDQKLYTLMFHFVMDKDPQFPLLSICTRNRFRKQLDFLLQNYTPIRMKDLINFVYEEKPLPRNSFLLTFDHGTKDHYDFVLPELRAKGLEGSFFIITSLVEEQRLPAIEKQRFLNAKFSNFLDYFQLFKENLCNLFPEYSNRIEPTEENLATNYLKECSFYSDHERLYRNVRDNVLEAKQFQIIMDTISADVFDEQKLIDQYYLNWDELQILQSEGMTIGSHGHNHILYSQSSLGDCINDVTKSFDLLRTRLNNPNIETITYANGEYSEALFSTLENIGVKIAFRDRPGVAITKSTHYKAFRIDTNLLDEYV